MSNKEEIKEEELNKEETTSQVEENQDVVEENKKEEPSAEELIQVEKDKFLLELILQQKVLLFKN